MVGTIVGAVLFLVGCVAMFNAVTQKDLPLINSLTNLLGGRKMRGLTNMVAMVVPIKDEKTRHEVAGSLVMIIVGAIIFVYQAFFTPGNV